MYMKHCDIGRWLDFLLFHWEQKEAAYSSVRIMNLKVAWIVILIQYISSMIYFFITKEICVHCIGKYKKI